PGRDPPPVRQLPRFAWVVLALLLPFALAQPGEPRTPQEGQGDGAAERDRLRQEVQRLERAGKVAEALAAARQALRLTRTHFGDVPAQADADLSTLARLCRRHGDLAGGPEARRGPGGHRGQLFSPPPG